MGDNSRKNDRIMKIVKAALEPFLPKRGNSISANTYPAAICYNKGYSLKNNAGKTGLLSAKLELGLHKSSTKKTTIVTMPQEDFALLEVGFWPFSPRPREVAMLKFCNAALRLQLKLPRPSIPHHLPLVHLRAHLQLVRVRFEL
ncbi:hypothetical protein NHQ30_011334 [Ciborinia camelliae]|nr:hypothetical protein NHQ30_011334 [Ciborinia camelliae]